MKNGQHPGFLHLKIKWNQNFAGFCVKSAEEGTILEETKLTYLPPINAPITDFSSICNIFEVIQKIADRVNMQYANITFDIGAAINAHKVLWNYPERFKNIIIHLGDFHFMIEIFAVLGKLVCGSGFKDVVFQTGICSSGSLNGVLSGSHYNRCWTVHSIFTEALERLLFKRSTECDNMPDRVRILLENESVKSFFPIKGYLYRHKRDMLAG